MAVFPADKSIQRYPMHFADCQMVPPAPSTAQIVPTRRFPQFECSC